MTIAILVGGCSGASSVEAQRSPDPEVSASATEVASGSAAPGRSASAAPVVTAEPATYSPPPAASTPAAPPVALGVKPKVTLGAPSVTMGQVDDAMRVIAGMTAGFRRCYWRGLEDDPTLSGSLTIMVKVGPNGEVLSATPTRRAGLTDIVVSCVAARVSSAQFSPPTGGDARISIPIKFDPDR
ncbi:MAG: AgmX/PglI C-terminal domain-containing protein [Polyangiaceae bacterium]